MEMVAFEKKTATGNGSFEQTQETIILKLEKGFQKNL